VYRNDSDSNTGRRACSIVETALIASRAGLLSIQTVTSFTRPSMLATLPFLSRQSTMGLFRRVLGKSRNHHEDNVHLTLSGDEDNVLQSRGKLGRLDLRHWLTRRQFAKLAEAENPLSPREEYVPPRNFLCILKSPRSKAQDENELDESSFDHHSEIKPAQSKEGTVSTKQPSLAFSASTSDTPSEAEFPQFVFDDAFSAIESVNASRQSHDFTDMVRHNNVLAISSSSSSEEEDEEEGECGGTLVHRPSKEEQHEETQQVMDDVSLANATVEDVFPSVREATILEEEEAVDPFLLDGWINMDQEEVWKEPPGDDWDEGLDAKPSQGSSNFDPFANISKSASEEQVQEEEVDNRISLLQTAQEAHTVVPKSSTDASRPEAQEMATPGGLPRTAILGSMLSKERQQLPSLLTVASSSSDSADTHPDGVPAKVVTTTVEEEAPSTVSSITQEGRQDRWQKPAFSVLEQWNQRKRHQYQAQGGEHVRMFAP